MSEAMRDFAVENLDFSRPHTPRIAHRRIADGAEQRLFLVFGGSADQWWLRLLAPGFRHCFAAIADDDGWTILDPLTGRLLVQRLPLAAAFDLPSVYARAGLAVLGPFTPAPARARLLPSVLPMNCVALCRALLGPDAPFALTPAALFRRLQKLTNARKKYLTSTASLPRKLLSTGDVRLVAFLPFPKLPWARPAPSPERSGLAAFRPPHCRRSVSVTPRPTPPESLPLEHLLARHARALERRRPFEAFWQDCYDQTLPEPGKAAQLFDATAADAAEQLAASLLAELCPPWSRWFGLAPARPLDDSPAARATALALEDAAEMLQLHLDRSNFALEMHQAFLDLVITGTGIILVEEAAPGEPSALRFAAVPLRETVLEEGVSGRLDSIWRARRLTAAAIAARYPGATLPPSLLQADDADEPARHRVLEAVRPDGHATRFTALLAGDDGRVWPLAEGRFAETPFIAFRWLKAPGETYGRGPVGKALPDIRTANLVVELVLKNASIAATGIWQAEDDGVLNPATIRLVPGAIIPKAPGSAGLTPLAAPGRFDVSQLVLNDLRARIRTALLADRLSAAAPGPDDGDRGDGPQRGDRPPPRRHLWPPAIGAADPAGHPLPRHPAPARRDRAARTGRAGAAPALRQPARPGPGPRGCRQYAAVPPGGGAARPRCRRTGRCRGGHPLARAQPQRAGRDPQASPSPQDGVSPA